MGACSVHGPCDELAHDARHKYGFLAETERLIEVIQVEGM